MIWHFIKMAWWALLATVPLAVWRLTNAIRLEIGCPPGDCYLPGTAAAGELDLLALAFVLFVWPVCLWHLAGLGMQLVRGLRGRGQPPDDPRTPG